MLSPPASPIMFVPTCGSLPTVTIICCHLSHYLQLLYRQCSRHCHHDHLSHWILQVFRLYRCSRHRHHGHLSHCFLRVFLLFRCSRHRDRYHLSHWPLFQHPRCCHLYSLSHFHPEQCSASIYRRYQPARPCRHQRVSFSTLSSPSVTSIACQNRLLQCLP